MQGKLEWKAEFAVLTRTSLFVFCADTPEVCVDMCADMCADMFVKMSIDMCADMCAAVQTCVQMSEHLFRY